MVHAACTRGHGDVCTDHRKAQLVRMVHDKAMPAAQSRRVEALVFVALNWIDALVGRDHPTYAKLDGAFRKGKKAREVKRLEADHLASVAQQPEVMERKNREWRKRKTEIDRQYNTCWANCRLCGQDHCFPSCVSRCDASKERNTKRWRPRPIELF